LFDFFPVGIRLLIAFNLDFFKEEIIRQVEIYQEIIHGRRI